jgi:hypothetical protein
MAMPSGGTYCSGGVDWRGRGVRSEFVDEGNRSYVGWANSMTQMTIAEGAAMLGDFVLGNWRFRVGRENEELLLNVSGVSLTWKMSDDESTWLFTFSVRRGGQWHKVEGGLVLPDPDDEDEDIYDMVRELGFSMLHSMMEAVFPDAPPDEDDDYVFGG